MSRQGPLYVWGKELTKAFPDLSKPQLKGLVEWSFGMVLARCCSLDSVASYVADWLGQPELSVRSRLREWYLPADPRGTYAASRPPAFSLSSRWLSSTANVFSAHSCQLVAAYSRRIRSSRAASRP